MSRNFRSKSKENKELYFKDRIQETTTGKKNENNNSEEQESNSPYPRKLKKKFLYFPVKNIYYPELFQNNLDFLDRFKCGICQNICENARYQYCGCNKPYCQKCLNFYYEYDNHRCPECKKETKELIPKETFNESISNLNMICKNYILNCNWRGKFKDYKRHLENECLKEVINCPNKGCEVKLKREQLPNHLIKCEYNEYICKKCLSKITLVEKDRHRSICPKEIITCECGSFFEREKIENHKKECPNEYNYCPYKYFGCNDKFKNKEKKERLEKDEEKHLNLAVNKIYSLDLKSAENERKLKLAYDKIEILEKKLDESMSKNKALADEFKKINEIIKNKSINKKSRSNSFDKSLISNVYKNNIRIKKELKNHKRKSFSQRKNKEEFLNIDLDCCSSFNSISYLSKKRKRNKNIENSNNKLKDENYVDYFDFSIFNDNEEEEKKDDIPPNNSIIVKKEDIYEVPNISKHLFVIKNEIIETTFLDGHYHYFIFYNKKYDVPKASEKKYTFKIKLLKDCDWLSVGFCDKKILEAHNYDYDDISNKKGKKTNMGIYSISTNRLIWNSNNLKQCMRIKKPIINKKNCTIECTIKPDACELEFMLNNQIFTILYDVRCFKSVFFSPFLIFLKNGSIETTFNYTN